MSQCINRRMLRRQTAGLLLLACLFSGTVHAWYQPYGYAPYSLYEDYAPGFGYYGYMQPRWQLHGHISRYGDYRIDLNVQGLSRYDMYRAWLMYQQLKLYRQLYAR